MPETCTKLLKVMLTSSRQTKVIVRYTSISFIKLLMSKMNSDAIFKLFYLG